MANRDDEQLVAALGRMVIADVAPREVARFDDISAAYFRGGRVVKPRKAPKDAALGAIVMDSLGYLTPLVLSIATEIVAQFLADKAQATLADPVRGLWDRLRRRFRGKRKQLALPPLEPLGGVQLAEAHAIVFEQARRMNLSEAQSLLVADAMVGSLIRLEGYAGPLPDGSISQQRS